MDNQLKKLLWFLFQPEASGDVEQIAACRRRTGRNPTPMCIFQEALKSAVWISISILLSLTIAHLN